MREPDPDKKMALRKTLAVETLPRWFGYLEKLLQDNGATASFVGELHADCCSPVLTN